LLSAGYIPSKITYRTMMQALDLRTDTAMRRKKSNSSTPTQSPTETFQFLLFVFDSLENRKLTVDSFFYSATLILGAQEGGLHKRIAYYLSQGRRRQKETADSGNGQADMSWEELILNYSDFKERGDREEEVKLPLIRVSSNDFGLVLAAEQAARGRLMNQRS
jgi:hypothetical protein